MGGFSRAMDGHQHSWNSLLFNCFMALACLITAALACGMALGFTSLDPFKLLVLCNVNSEDLPPDSKDQAERLEKDQKFAAAILPSITGHFFENYQVGRWNPTNSHYTLVALLTTSAMASEALPIFLEQMMHPVAAVICSMSLVLLFCEIIPSAIFTGPDRLRLTSKMTPLLNFLQYVTFITTCPLSLVLDRVLGHEDDETDRARLKALVRTIPEGCLQREEADLLQNVLGAHAKSPMDLAQTLRSKHLVLDSEVVGPALVEKVLKWRRPEVFVCRTSRASSDFAGVGEDAMNIVGVIHASSIMGLASKDANMQVSDMGITEPVVVDESDNLFAVLEAFRDTSAQTALISPDAPTALLALQQGKPIPPAARPTKIVTLLDVLREIMQLEGGRSMIVQHTLSNQAGHALDDLLNDYSKQGTGDFVGRPSCVRPRKTSFDMGATSTSDRAATTASRVGIQIELATLNANQATMAAEGR